MVMDGLIKMVEANAQLNFIGSANNGVIALEQILLLQPKFILLDIDLIGLNGLLVLERLRKESFSGKVLMLSQHQEQHIINKSKQLGADGYLIKSSSPVEFDMAVAKIINGQTHFQNASDNIQEIKKIVPDDDTAIIISKLSEREKEIISLITEGYSNKEIGSQLFISHRTVDTHRTNVMKKLNASNVANLVSLAYKYGLVE
jgi:two-component system response regulator NreC